MTDNFVPLSPVRRVALPTVTGFFAYVAVNHPEDMPLSASDITAVETFLSHASRTVLTRSRESGTNRIANMVGEYVDSCTN